MYPRAFTRTASDFLALPPAYRAYRPSQGMPCDCDPRGRAGVLAAKVQARPRWLAIRGYRRSSCASFISSGLRGRATHTIEPPIPAFEPCVGVRPTFGAPAVWLFGTLPA